MSDIYPVDIGSGMFSLGAGGASAYFPNLESYEGQILFTPPTISGSREAEIGRTAAVPLIRQLERTNEHIRSGLQRKADMVVGSDLRIQPAPDWATLGITKAEGRALALAFDASFRDWSRDPRACCDAEGHYDFGGMMRMAYLNTISAEAETAGILHFSEKRRRRLNTRWATFAQVLDPTRIATPPDKASDPSIFAGRRLDRWGRMTGFYMKQLNPNDRAAYDGSNFSFIPRETSAGRPVGWHWFRKDRAGTQRGLSPLVTILKPAHQLEKFDEAQLGAAILSAMFAMFVKSNSSPESLAAQLAPAPDGESFFDKREDFYKKIRVAIGPQRLAVLPPMDELVIAAINRAAQDPTAFVNQFLRKFALAINIPFEVLSGNYTEANYSSIRASLIDAWRSVLSERGMFGRHVPPLLYSAVIEEAIAREYVVLPPSAPPFEEFRNAYTRCSITGPAMGWVDPKKEAEAIEILVDRLKISNRTKEAAKAGEDIEEVVDGIANEIDLFGAIGIDLFAAPVVSTGAAAGSKEGGDDDEDEDDDEYADDEERAQAKARKGKKTKTKAKAEPETEDA